MSVRTERPLDELRTDREASTLPKERDTSRQLWAAEHDTLWRRTWQWACREEDVATPGSYAVYDILDQSVLILATSAAGRTPSTTCACTVCPRSASTRGLASCS